LKTLKGALEVTSDKRGTYINDEKFKHFTRPTQVTRGDLDHKVGGFVNLFVPFQPDESRDHEHMERHMERVLMFDASFSQFFNDRFRCSRRRGPKEDTRFNDGSPETLGIVRTSLEEVVTSLEPVLWFNELKYLLLEPRAHPINQLRRPFNQQPTSLEEVVPSLEPVLWFNELKYLLLEPRAHPINQLRRPFNHSQMKWNKAKYSSPSSNTIFQMSPGETISPLSFHSFTRYMKQQHSAAGCDFYLAKAHH
jgi:hypothetical protein